MRIVTDLIMKTFPVLNHENYANCPPSIPWSLIEPHAKQAEKVHSQTLDELARRGGLAPDELVAVLSDKNFYEYWQSVPNKNALAVMKLIRFVNPQTQTPTTATVKKKNR